MVGESGTSRTMKVHRYYKCVTAKKRRGCDKKPVKKDWIENIVVNQALRLLADDAILEKITAMILALQKQENTALPLLRKQLAEAERGIENMLNAIQQGILNQSTKKRLDDLEAAKSDIEVKILQEEMQKPLLTREQILFWLHKFRGIDTTKCEQRQRLIDTFVNAVYLYDDKIVLTFNYKDGAKTITMAEIENNYGSDLTASGAPDRFSHSRQSLAGEAVVGQCGTVRGRVAAPTRIFVPFCPTVCSPSEIFIYNSMYYMIL